MLIANVRSDQSSSRLADADHRAADVAHLREVALAR
jgi:hypothetical protein